MPVVDVDPDELRYLTGHSEKDDDELKSDLFNLGLEFEGWTEDDEFQLEFAPDRLDRLSVEGVARSLRYHYGDDRGVEIPNTNSADWTIEVEDQPDERPYVTGAIVRGLDMDEAALESLIQLQEKLHATMGRKRAKGAIGVHDLTMLKGDSVTDETGKSITYTSADPDEATFVPLDADAEMTPSEVMASHETGQTYGDLVADFDRVPAIYDAIGLFSFPPVINGRRTEVSVDSRDLFIEMTGTNQWTIDHMCNIVCYALAARGGQVEKVDVSYADDAPGEYAGKTLERPDFSVRTKTVTHDRIESILGVSLDSREVVDYAERAGLDATETESDDGVAYDVEVPPYRVDVIHPLDIIDDIGRALGFNSLEPTYPDVSTVGGRHERSRLEDAARDALVGLGFEDLLNFHMTNEVENFERMNLSTPEAEDGNDADTVGLADPVTIQEPYSEDYTILRTWALPSIMMVLENNTHRSYPQDLAEIGLAAGLDDSENTGVAEHRTVAAALARTDASYEDAKARLQALADAFDKDLETPPTTHPSFIGGRAAEVVLDGESVGVIGEIHPKVLVEHDLELPVAAFEFRLDALA
ncbi:phenylalanyl-tRNA synthetase beta chain [Haloarcula marismortui ATCC 43049]|uniref:Phenylalanine--tRNA ligase beta subunit n=2 Tax=Haloarcula marismortui (strain ATCC 43049 / DSM 3752 / JCM 8966 / VKM B-1809) TaxID=272569 RepID=SYFB_HALMA|nr:phenylalanine--tRNA ligase subunit beta [Haloarcula marismortui]Q5UYF3.1 RecName: Full=Phenylalanine--tRNA ligase beta subunit; AltName: Full=Phenylalanyl-tRNA synthetase beta subunit; Short=PheRS [Haloarcula marismortui ATCC 43049]AAV47700.1 phenylalanyl-tRNA synthetase beta chain [Haloarcula marismortui ATCC 43049]QCP92384.1 phenylalanine--tRNA ligase subunit beta [Haloarcula marismortui ATCC 43049]